MKYFPDDHRFGTRVAIASNQAPDYPTLDWGRWAGASGRWGVGLGCWEAGVWASWQESGEVVGWVWGMLAQVR